MGKGATSGNYKGRNGKKIVKGGEFAERRGKEMEINGGKRRLNPKIRSLDKEN